MKYVKFMVCAAFYWSGLLRWLRWRQNATGRKVTIVTFHRVADRSADDPRALPTLIISCANFRKTIRCLARHYRFISLDELLDGLSGRAELPADSLLLTFDDAYQDVFENAVPLLKRERIPATVFVPTAFVESDDRVFWWDECYFLLRAIGDRPEVLERLIEAVDRVELRDQLQAMRNGRSAEWGRSPIVTAVDILQTWSDGDRRKLLDSMWEKLDIAPEPPVEGNRVASWSEIRAAAAAGISFGSHTCNHVFLDSEPPDVARRELRESKAEIEQRLGQKVRTFAYPGGKVTNDARRWVADAGYDCALTAERGLNTQDEPPFALKRISVWNGTVQGPRGSFSKLRLAFNLRMLG